MKRAILLPLALLVFTGLLAGCVGATTITEEAGSYVYKMNEEIAVVDIETRETFGVLAVTGARVLFDGPFDVREVEGKDEAGEPVYKTVTYSQIVQVFYTYTGEKKLSGANFTVRDRANVIAKNPNNFDPKPAYTPASQPGQSSFIVALRNPGGPLEATFTYNVLQIRPTARIEIAL